MANWTSRIGAWIYPGSPACNANVEYADGRIIYMLKPEYYRVNQSGTGVLEQMTVASDGCNAYSLTNAASVRTYSTKQFFTISCDTGADLNALCSDSTKRTNAINTIISFLNTIQFTGVELDWEGYSSWSATHYTNFLTFIAQLSTALHAAGYQLMIDGPPITAASDAVNGQNLYKFKYEDVAPYCDYIVALAYDKQYDYGAPTPISPTIFVQQVCDWMIAKVGNLDQIVIGMPSYGYTGSDALYNINIKTYDQLSPITGFGTATRNSDYEMNWQNTPAINATGSLLTGATSATLASAWVLPSGIYTVTFSNGNSRRVNASLGSTSITWSGTGNAGLTAGATSTLTWTAVDLIYQDTSGMNSKRTVIEAKGIRHTSVWHLGGNHWFTGTEPSNPSYINTSVTNLASVTNLQSITI